MASADHINSVGQALVALGAPLIDWEPVAHWPPEETLARAIEGSHAEPAVLRVLPLLLVRHEHGLDFDRLRSLAGERRVLPELGMILEIVGELTKQPRWADRASQVGTPPRERRYYFPVAGEFARRSAEAKTPKAALSWGFFLNMPLESFRSAIQKHGG